MDKETYKIRKGTTFIFIFKNKTCVRLNTNATVLIIIPVIFGSMANLFQSRLVVFRTWIIRQSNTVWALVHLGSRLGTSVLNLTDWITLWNEKQTKLHPLSLLEFSSQRLVTMSASLRTQTVSLCLIIQVLNTMSLLWNKFAMLPNITGIIIKTVAFVFSLTHVLFLKMKMEVKHLGSRLVVFRTWIVR